MTPSSTVLFVISFYIGLTSAQSFRNAIPSPQSLLQKAATRYSTQDDVTEDTPSSDEVEDEDGVEGYIRLMEDDVDDHDIQDAEPSLSTLHTKAIGDDHDDHDHAHEEAQEEVKLDHADDHDEHHDLIPRRRFDFHQDLSMNDDTNMITMNTSHDDRVKVMSALKNVLVEIDATIVDVDADGKELEAIGRLEHATEELASALAIEKGHVKEESYESKNDHEHSAKKLAHSLEHLKDAIENLKDHRSDGTDADEEHHATKDLQHSKHEVSHALSSLQRASAMGRVEHALRDLFQGMIAATGANPETAAPAIQHAIKDLEHTMQDLKEMTSGEHKFEQDSHALEDIGHAIARLKHQDLAAIQLKDLGERKEGESDAEHLEHTEHLKKHLNHAVANLKFAYDDLHTAHALSDLHCALHDVGHIGAHKEPKEKQHVADDAALDLVYVATSAVKSNNLYKNYGARLLKAADRLKKNPSSKNAAYAKKSIDRGIRAIQTKCEKRHGKVMKSKCYQECEEAHHKCVNTPHCKSLEKYAQNEKACLLASGTCKSNSKACRKKCKKLKHEHEKHAGHDHQKKPTNQTKPAIQKRL